MESSTSNGNPDNKNQGGAPEPNPNNAESGEQNNAADANAFECRAWMVEECGMSGEEADRFITTISSDGIRVSRNRFKNAYEAESKKAEANGKKAFPPVKDLTDLSLKYYLEKQKKAVQNELPPPVVPVPPLPPAVPPPLPTSTIIKGAATPPPFPGTPPPFPPNSQGQNSLRNHEYDSKNFDNFMADIRSRLYVEDYERIPESNFREIFKLWGDENPKDISGLDAFLTGLTFGPKKRRLLIVPPGGSSWDPKPAVSPDENFPGNLTLEGPKYSFGKKTEITEYDPNNFEKFKEDIRPYLYDVDYRQIPEEIHKKLHALWIKRMPKDTWGLREFLEGLSWNDGKRKLLLVPPGGYSTDPKPPVSDKDNYPGNPPPQTGETSDGKTAENAEFDRVAFKQFKKDIRTLLYEQDYRVIEDWEFKDIYKHWAKVDQKDKSELRKLLGILTWKNGTKKLLLVPEGGSPTDPKPEVPDAENFPGNRKKNSKIPAIATIVGIAALGGLAAAGLHKCTDGFTRVPGFTDDTTSATPTASGPKPVPTPKVVPSVQPKKTAEPVATAAPTATQLPVTPPVRPSAEAIPNNPPTAAPSVTALPPVASTAPTAAPSVTALPPVASTAPTAAPSVTALPPRVMSAADVISKKPSPLIIKCQNEIIPTNCELPDGCQQLRTSFSKKVRFVCRSGNDQVTYATADAASKYRHGYFGIKFYPEEEE